MKADPRFRDQPKSFWALVRCLSECLGYTVKSRARRGEPKVEGQVAVHTVGDQVRALRKLKLNPEIVLGADGPTQLGTTLEEYFCFRATVLNQTVLPLLMDKEEAGDLFREHRARLRPTCPMPMNKQRGEKRAEAYFTGLVNMLVQQTIAENPCDYDPQRLTTFTQDGIPVRTMARRMDGAFPSAVNPIAIWEIKEYYYTTTFGSRVAGGVYETLLDGMELEEMRKNEGVAVIHCLFVDSRFTWWSCGRSYLCRLIDMLNMGYADEVVFGREVLARVPELAAEWMASYREKMAHNDPDSPVV